MCLPLSPHAELSQCFKNHLPIPPSSNLAIINLFTVYSFAFSRMSYSWKNTLHSLLRLTAFTWQYAFKFPPCLFVA